MTARNPSSARLRVTPGRILIGVLAVEILLLLAVQFHWPPVGDRKGWPVLVCLAVVAAALVLLVMWFAITRLSRQSFQFSLRSILLLTLVVAVASGWMLREMQQAKRQAELVAKANEVGCAILFSYNISNTGGISMFTGPTPGATRLNKLLGDDFFRDVAGAQPRNPAGLGLVYQLTSIRVLLLNGSKVEDIYFAPLEKLNRLEWLDLTDAANFSDARLQHLRGLTQLQSLLLRRTNVSDEGMENIKDLTSLQVLDLGMTKVSGAGLKHLAGLTNLRQLQFWGNQIDDAGVSYLHGLTQLRVLDLGFAQITDAGLEHLKNMRELKNLGLRGSQITDAGLGILQNFENLRELDLYKTKITDAGLEQLAGLTHLEHLTLGEIQTTPEGIQKLQKALPNCKIRP